MWSTLRFSDTLSPNYQADKLINALIRFDQLNKDLIYNAYSLFHIQFVKKKHALYIPIFGIMERFQKKNQMLNDKQFQLIFANV